MDRALLKANARRQLGGGIFSENWLNGLLVVLIYSAIVGAASSVISGVTGVFSLFPLWNLSSFTDMFSSVLNDPEAYSPEFVLISLYQRFMPVYIGVFGAGLLISVLLVGPFTYGISKTFYDLVMGGEKIKIETMFSGFRKYGETVLLGIMMSLFTALWSLLFIIPGIVKMYAYVLSYFVKIDHPEYTCGQCMKESQRLMKGCKFSYFILQISFFGWFIVGALVCGVGNWFVLPYLLCTNANFYAWRIANDGAANGSEAD